MTNKKKKITRMKMKKINYKKKIYLNFSLLIILPSVVVELTISKKKKKIGTRNLQLQLEWRDLIFNNTFALMFLFISLL